MRTDSILDQLLGMRCRSQKHSLRDLCSSRVSECPVLGSGVARPVLNDHTGGTAEVGKRFAEHL